MFKNAYMIALISCLLLTSNSVLAEVSRIEIEQRQMLGQPSAKIRYESITGTIYFTLDPENSGNQAIVDLQYAPRNAQNLVEFSSDFKLMVPRGEIVSDTLIYSVNNRGRSTLPPESDLSHPLNQFGHTYLVTGWINELIPGNNLSLLQAPIVSNGQTPITGDVRYEVIVNRTDNDVNIAGASHLAYAPTANGLSNATLTRRTNQSDPREPVPREAFTLNVEPVAGSNQFLVTLNVQGALQPGEIYELIYEAKDPVLSGAGLAGIRDSVSLLRYGGNDETVLADLQALELPAYKNTVSWGVSQSGRLLRQFLYQGFNEDLEGRRVLDGVMPVIAGAGYGMFNVRFAMPTRTNGQHENLLYPNDYFPFTYGESTDPYSGRVDSVLAKARASNTEPKLMHIQTSNEYWIRAGSLVHTDPLGQSDAIIPDNVRIYAIGGSQHSSGGGTVRPASSGQLPPNHNRWTPISETLLQSLVNWVALDKLPPASRYPRISDQSLVPSHIGDNVINPAAWNALSGYEHPKQMYQIGFAQYGENFFSKGIIDSHPMRTSQYYRALVPAVNSDNNDSFNSTVLPPLSAAPLGTFIPWNLRATATGAPSELARLSGGYIGFSATPAQAQVNADTRPALNQRYKGFTDYLKRYEEATNELIELGFLLPEFKSLYLDMAKANEQMF